jgi:adenine-specific DNA-methyltransferase
MEKMKCHTPDITAENIQKLAAIFPNCVVEAKDVTGKLIRSVDFDQLRQELSTSVVEGPRERYHLDWPGKREALLTANAPIAKTLRPCRRESVNFDTTKNLFIEGDNLDALKLLQETYLGKVKMIYIDPPYNTGKEFIYDDVFEEDTEMYFHRSNQKDEDGNRMIENLESNGRFHSDWLTMIYARLKLARNLLMEDGVIFISIDSGESANLRIVCDELFGAANFINELVWVKATKPLNTSNSGFSRNTESILTYSKSSTLAVKPLPLTEKHAATYRNPDNDLRGPWTKVPLFLRTNSNKPKALKTPWDGNQRTEKWFCSQATLDELWNTKRIIVSEKQVYKKIFLSESDGRRPLNILESDLTGYSRNGTEDLKDLGLAMDYPKPVALIKFLTDRVIPPSEGPFIILDFFAGSATTAHAVMSLNNDDYGMRRYILIQIPEPCREDSEAKQAGFENIAEICKERLRRAGSKTLEGIRVKQGAANRGAGPDLFTPLSSKEQFSPDIGFRVLKVDTSNMTDVFYSPDSVKQTDLIALTDNFKQDRSPEDLLFQVLVDWGVDLALPITWETIAGKVVFFVDGDALAACFDAAISEELVKEVAKRKPLRAVFRDSCYGDDSVKMNAVQIFKTLSPKTEIKSL